MKLLLIDNYDSFTYNLYHDLGKLGADLNVSRNDKITIEDGDLYEGDDFSFDHYWCTLCGECCGESEHEILRHVIQHLESKE